MFAPLWVPAVVLASASQPGLLGVASAGLDHCLAHAHRHHLCWLHLPHVSGHLAAWLVPGAVATPVALVLGAEAWRMGRAARLAAGVASLGRASDRSGHDPVTYPVTPRGPGACRSARDRGSRVGMDAAQAVASTPASRPR